MVDSPIGRSRKRPRKAIVETIRKDLSVNDLNINKINDKILWCYLTPVTDPA